MRYANVTVLLPNVLPGTANRTTHNTWIYRRSSTRGDVDQRISNDLRETKISKDSGITYSSTFHLVWKYGLINAVNKLYVKLFCATPYVYSSRFHDPNISPDRLCRSHVIGLSPLGPKPFCPMSLGTLALGPLLLGPISC